MKTTKARAWLLQSGALAALLIAGAAQAQETPAQQTPAPQDSTAGGLTDATQDEVAQNIIVTGSRIRGVAPIGSPLTAIGPAEIAASGALTTDRILKELPQVFDLGISENSRGQSGGSGNIAYGNTVNLRGIGPYATLVLVDGHRAVNNSRAFDPSVIPTLGLERVEVIADGASAIYGSDAIAGVVNLIPRRSLDGGEVTARYGISDDGAYTEYQLGAAFGKKWSTGQFMVAYEHVFRSNLNGSDRDYFRSDQTAFGGSDYRVTRCAPGTLHLASGTSYALPAQYTAANAGSIVNGTSNKCDDLIGQDLFPEQKYDSANATFTQEITPWLTFFADGFYSKRDYKRYPAYFSSTLTVPQTNAFFVRPPGFTGTSYTIDYNFINDLPRDVSTGYAENWEVTPGVRITLPHGWQFEGLFTYGRGDDESNQWHGQNATALAAALASSDPNTAFDPYGLHRTSQATLDAISNYWTLSPTLNHFNGYEARLNGPLFRLPGGEVKFAAGYEGQEMVTILGSARGAAGTPITWRTFTRRVDSGYAELIVPVFSADNAIPGFQRLEFDAAVRYDKYSDVGDTTNPKFGVNWSPVRGLTLRGSYGTSFRAPIVSQIYGNSNNLFGQTYQNPAGGAPLTGFAYSGPNLDLKPEEATTWSVGGDWDVAPGLKLGLTYWNVKYINQVDSYLSDLAILTREAQFAGTGIILRGTAARDRVLELLAQGVTLARGTFPGGDPNNVTLYIDGRNNNLGQSTTRGIDFTANYTLETARAGTFNLNLGGTYLTVFKAAISAAGTPVDRRNTIFFPLTFKARGSLVWELDPVSIRIAATHVGGYENNAITPTQQVKSYTPIDLSITWNIGDPHPKTFFDGGFAFTLEARNIFDIDPPYVNLAPGVNGSGGYDATASNPIGRLIAASVRKRF